MTAPRNGIYVLQGVQPSQIAAAPVGVKVVEIYDDSKTLFDAAQVTQMEAGGGLLLGYFSIGEAENYRDYWASLPAADKGPVDPSYPGDYEVAYWTPEWLTICENYVSRMVTLGYNGVYFDVVNEYTTAWAAAHAPGGDAATAMVNLIQTLANYAHNTLNAPNFQIWVNTSGAEDLLNNTTFVNSIDGAYEEDLFYQNNSGSFSPEPTGYTSTNVALLQKLVSAGKSVIAIEYVTGATVVANVETQAAAAGIGYYIANPNLELLGVNPEGFSAPCFVEGAMIAIPEGEMPVEKLAVGDQVLTINGESKPIVWIGVGHVLVTGGRRTASSPIILRKGALSDNVPHHDLRVTKGHAFYLDGVLIPAEFLVNHRSIMWDDHAKTVRIYHVELETHDVILANGAPAESYRDDGNRNLFNNSNTGWGLPPLKPFAPVVTGGPVVDAAWRRLLDRAGPRPGLPLTDEPDLHLLVNGIRLDAVSRFGTAYVFRLPDPSATVTIASYVGTPAELGIARDPRPLGVALSRMVVRQRALFQVTDASNPLLSDGFHAFEPDLGLRWTDGAAKLPAAVLDGFKGPVDLVLHIPCTTTYPLLNGYEDRHAA